jgi:hypothetical protein
VTVRHAAPMGGERPHQGIVDTDFLVLRRWIDPTELVLQRAESEFDPVPFDAEAARIFGRVTAAVQAAGRKPRRRFADLMIASTAIAEGLPLFTTNPDDFLGLDALARIIRVTRPSPPDQRSSV